MATESIQLPKVFWTVVSSLAGLSLLLLASFFSWLGITSVSHGESLKVQGSKLTTIQVSIDRIENKLENLPPREVIELPIRLKSIEADAKNRERQVDEIERRIDALEKKTLN